MKIGIFTDISNSKLQALCRRLASRKVKPLVIEGSIPPDVELLIVVGSDRTVLKAFHMLREESVPVLGVSIASQPGFLTEITIDELKGNLDLLLEGDYEVEPCPRLSTYIDGKPAPPALNEVALFPYRSATLMKYELWVDGRYVWRDYSDGVIIATPIGSTAYSMSAGGPMVLPSARVFVITPVNSMDLTRRPLIVPEDSMVEVSEIVSRCEVEAVIDGIERLKVKESLRAVKAKSDALLVRLHASESHAYRKMRGKLRLSEELMKMPPSAKLTLKILEYEGPMTQRDLLRKTMLPARTLRHALSILIKKGLVGRMPNLRDARQTIYYLRQEVSG